MTKWAALAIGTAVGFVLAWARLSDPVTIRAALLLQSPYVFLVMGSAVVIAAVGLRGLRFAGARALLTGERIDWSVDLPQMHHVTGSALFAVGWTLAATCPGPLAAMLGEGKLGALPILVGLIGGIRLQSMWLRRHRAATKVGLATPAF
jgi:uncharacterized membrane protein YedE/YeeE